MLNRIERAAAPLRRPTPQRRRKPSGVFNEPLRSELALAYSNGYVTVEISHDALDAYMDMTGDVPLPIAHDDVTGDRRTYDARHRVRVVYDASSAIREISTRSRDGLFVRLNFVDD